jgi:hypothetical protein
MDVCALVFLAASVAFTRAGVFAVRGLDDAMARPTA